MESDMEFFKYIVVYKQDTEPIEVSLFRDKQEAINLYEELKLNWTEVYLCIVERGTSVNLEK